MDTMEERHLHSPPDYFSQLSFEVLVRILHYLPVQSLLRLERLSKHLQKAVGLHLQLLKSLDFTSDKWYGFMPIGIDNYALRQLLRRCTELEYIYGLHPSKLLLRNKDDNMMPQTCISISGVISALQQCRRLIGVEISDTHLLEAILTELPTVEILGRFRNRDGRFPCDERSQLTLPTTSKLTCLHLHGILLSELPALNGLDELHLQFVKFSSPQPFQQFQSKWLLSFMMHNCIGPTNPLHYVPLLAALGNATHLRRLDLVRVPFLGGLLQHVVEDVWKKGGFSGVEKVRISTCKNCFEPDIGYLLLASEYWLEELSLQPSLTKDSFFWALKLAKVNFSMFETLELGYVHPSIKSGEWTNIKFVEHGLTDYTESPGLVSDLGMSLVELVFNSVLCLTIHNCPYLQNPLLWNSEQIRWEWLKSLHLDRCHSIQLDKFCEWLTLLPVVHHVHLENMFRVPPKGCSMVGLSAGTGLGVASAFVAPIGQMDTSPNTADDQHENLNVNPVPAVHNDVLVVHQPAVRNNQSSKEKACQSISHQNASPSHQPKSQIKTSHVSNRTYSQDNLYPQRHYDEAQVSLGDEPDCDDQVPWLSLAELEAINSYTSTSRHIDDYHRQSPGSRSPESDTETSGSGGNCFLEQKSSSELSPPSSKSASLSSPPSSSSLSTQHPSLLSTSSSTISLSPLTLAPETKPHIIHKPCSSTAQLPQRQGKRKNNSETLVKDKHSSAICEAHAAPSTSRESGRVFQGTIEKEQNTGMQNRCPTLEENFGLTCKAYVQECTYHDHSGQMRIRAVRSQSGQSSVIIPSSDQGRLYVSDQQPDIQPVRRSLPRKFQKSENPDQDSVGKTNIATTKRTEEIDGRVSKHSKGKEYSKDTYNKRKSSKYNRDSTQADVKKLKSTEISHQVVVEKDDKMEGVKHLLKSNKDTFPKCSSPKKFNDSSESSCQRKIEHLNNAPVLTSREDLVGSDPSFPVDILRPYLTPTNHNTPFKTPSNQKLPTIRKVSTRNQSTSTSDPIPEDDPLQTMVVTSKTLEGLTLDTCGISHLHLLDCPQLATLTGCNLRIFKELTVKNCPSLTYMDFSAVPKLTNPAVIEPLTWLPPTCSRFIKLSPLYMKNKSALETWLFAIDHCNYQLMYATESKSSLAPTEGSVYMANWMDITTWLNSYYVSTLSFPNEDKSKMKTMDTSARTSTYSTKCAIGCSKFKLTTNVPWLRTLSSNSTSEMLFGKPLPEVYLPDRTNIVATLARGCIPLLNTDMAEMRSRKTSIFKFVLCIYIQRSNIKGLNKNEFHQ